MARSLMLDRDVEPRFSQPVRQIVFMFIVLALLSGGVYLIFGAVRAIFESHLALTGFIAFVFLIGIFACFWQMFQLWSAVGWIEGFALDRPGHEFTRAPSLLASLSALLRGKDARRQLTASSTRSILDSVATRLDESRDITRYLANLMIFLGLLGTFWGLSLTMPEVVRVIQSLNVETGADPVGIFRDLMDGLKGQLYGIGTAFSASLVGLAGSLTLGLLDLFAGHGQNRFYRELEEWLSSITRIGLATSDADPAAGEGGLVAGVMAETALQIESLKDIVLKAEERRLETDERLAMLSQAVSSLVTQLASGKLGGGVAAPDVSPVLERIAAAQERVVAMMKERAEDAGQLDAETRMRMKNIDLQLLRILEEMAAGRQDSVSEIRTEINTLTRTIAAAARAGS